MSSKYFYYINHWRENKEIILCLEKIHKPARYIRSRRAQSLASSIQCIRFSFRAFAFLCETSAVLLMCTVLIIIEFKSLALISGVSSLFLCFQLISLPPNMTRRVKFLYYLHVACFLLFFVVVL